MKVKCDNCDKEFEKKLADIKRTKHNYCCKSCAGQHSNKIRNKTTYLQPQGKCKICSTPVQSYKTYCSKCKTKKFPNDPTLKEAIYTRHHKSSAFALVRSRARAIAKSLGWKSCSNCGYDKHVEIDHIKPICEFDESTKLSIINDPSNLRPLCPNCHWEFNHGS